jgi:hypothetical protein
MIVIYPLLLSDTVSKNIVPGLAKVIERYLLIYKMDEILQSAKSGGYRKKLKVQGGKLIIKEQDDDEEEDLFLPHSRTKPLTPKEEEEQEKSRKDLEYELKRKRHEQEKKKAENNAKSATMDIGTMDMQSLSAEPTWVKIDVQTGDIKTSELLGVKVVPVIVKSSEKLVRILMFDKNVKGLHGQILTLGRSIIRWSWKIWHKFWSSVPIVGKGRGTTTGDARQDILLHKTIYSHDKRANIFLSINFQDLDDDLFFNNAASINKLFKKGWESFVVCDDVNRIAHFCMEEFKGMTASLNYAMIYQTIGQFKVYESLEDVKRSSSALFKRKMKTSKLISAALSKQKLNKYGRK